ncbi:MAG: hypothetical protein M5U09_19275 [Gammaproteobacteria bacterium]|nr:hypothetical protein [Gammaproteobacteria bacterium]
MAAAVRRHHGLAVGGFIACLAMGLAMGVLGALPTAIVFTIAIVTRPAGEGGSTAPD